MRFAEFGFGRRTVIWKEAWLFFIEDLVAKFCQNFLNLRIDIINLTIELGDSQNYINNDHDQQKWGRDELLPHFGLNQSFILYFTQLKHVIYSAAKVAQNEYGFGHNQLSNHHFDLPVKFFPLRFKIFLFFLQEGLKFVQNDFNGFLIGQTKF